jgi:hypothetical protein
MATPRKYFHDHLVLLLLSINAFLALAGSIYILVLLGTSHGNGYIVQCRDCSNPNAINRFTSGSILELLALAAFAIMVFVIHTTLSLRTYKIHRQLAIAILAMGVLLLLLTLRIGGSLLALR